MVTKDQIKKHYEEYKTAYYICGGAILVVASVLITRGIMKKNLSGVLSVPDTGMLSVPSPNVQLEDSASLLFAQGNNINQKVKVIYKGEKGHPGFITKCLETGDVFSSQKKAATFANTSPSNMSSHLSGLFEDVNGLHFERVVVQ